MRYWLVVLLLVFLPLQSTWAAAGRYCQHESGVAAQHIGHHAHQHAIQDGEKVEVKFLKSTLMGDADCDFCHPCCCVLVIEVPKMVSCSMALEFNLVYQNQKALNFSALPDRPNWTHLA